MVLETVPSLEVTVTASLPVPIGATKVIAVSLQVEASKVTPLNVMVPTVPKSVPLMVTMSPIAPLLGDKLLMTGEMTTGGGVVTVMICVTGALDPLALLAISVTV